MNATTDCWDSYPAPPPVDEDTPQVVTGVSACHAFRASCESYAAHVGIYLCHGYCALCEEVMPHIVRGLVVRAPSRILAEVVAANVRDFVGVIHGAF